jgi:hypothetical protein
LAATDFGDQENFETGISDRFSLSSMASPRLSTRHFGIRKPAQVWADAASRHSPAFGPGA